jgi:hypothetical protein
MSTGVWEVIIRGKDCDVIWLGAYKCVVIWFLICFCDWQICRKLSLVLNDAKAPLDVIAFAAISLGLVCVGSCNEVVAHAIILSLMERSKSDLQDPLTRFLPLGLGLLYLGKQVITTWGGYYGIQYLLLYSMYYYVKYCCHIVHGVHLLRTNIFVKWIWDTCNFFIWFFFMCVQQESVEATAEVSKTFDEKIRKYCYMTLLSCAYAGTGNVLKVIYLIHLMLLIY